MHVMAAKRVLRYLKTTSELQIQYRLIGYTDSRNWWQDVSSVWTDSGCGPVPIGCGNQGAIKLVTSAMVKQKPKHIDVKYHHVQDKQEKGSIQEGCDSERKKGVLEKENCSERLFCLYLKFLHHVGKCEGCRVEAGVIQSKCKKGPEEGPWLVNWSALGTMLCKR